MGALWMRLIKCAAAGGNDLQILGDIFLGLRGRCGGGLCGFFEESSDETSSLNVDREVHVTAGREASVTSTAGVSGLGVFGHGRFVDAS